MGISLKVRIGIVATILMPFAISSAVDARLFRRSCTANNRGIGQVSTVDVTKSEILLEWQSPGYVFQSIHVCYKKNWAPVGKCDGGKDAYKTYGSPVSYGDIRITGLDDNSCYKFAVYGADSDPEVLIGQEKVKTDD
jgi:hypothetical protein